MGESSRSPSLSPGRRAGPTTTTGNRAGTALPGRVAAGTGDRDAGQLWKRTGAGDREIGKDRDRRPEPDRDAGGEPRVLPSRAVSPGRPHVHLRCTCMGVSRHRGSSRSSARDTGIVRRDSSRVRGRVVVSAFVASAPRFESSRERSHRCHSENSGGGHADAWASRRTIGGTACRACCGLAATGPGVAVGTAAAGPSEVCDAGRKGDCRAGKPAAWSASLAASTAATWRCHAVSGSRSSNRAGTSATWSWMPESGPCWHAQAREAEAEPFGSDDGSHQLVVACRWVDHPTQAEQPAEVGHRHAGFCGDRGQLGHVADQRHGGGLDDGQPAPLEIRVGGSDPTAADHGFGCG
jgi:hypothetical protein